MPYADIINIPPMTVNKLDAYPLVRKRWGEVGHNDIKKHILLPKSSIDFWLSSIIYLGDELKQPVSSLQVSHMHSPPAVCSSKLGIVRSDLASSSLLRSETPSQETPLFLELGMSILQHTHTGLC